MEDSKVLRNALNPLIGRKKHAEKNKARVYAMHAFSALALFFLCVRKLIRV